LITPGSCKTSFLSEIFEARKENSKREGASKSKVLKVKFNVTQEFVEGQASNLKTFH